MPIVENQTQREYWKVTNVSNKMIVIGDLPKVPTIEPGETHDLLRYYSKDQVTQSKYLLVILRKGWFTAKKNLDDVDTTVSQTSPNEYYHTIEENELNDATDEIQEITDDLQRQIDEMQKSLSTGVINISGDYHVETADYQIIICDASDGNITVYLPRASTETDKTYYIKKIDSSNHIVTVKPYGTETIDGQPQLDITIQYECYKIVCTGVKWWII